MTLGLVLEPGYNGLWNKAQQLVEDVDSCDDVDVPAKCCQHSELGTSNVVRSAIMLYQASAVAQGRCKRLNEFACYEKACHGDLNFAGEMSVVVAVRVQVLRFTSRTYAERNLSKMLLAST